MDVITKITKTKREYNVTINDEKVLRLDRKIISKLKVEDEVDIDELIKESYDDLYDTALNMALNYLSYAMRCEQEIVDYLDKKHFPDIVINDVLNRLLELKYVNDEDYIENFTRSKSASLIGRNKIKNDLIKKGIDVSLVIKTVERCFGIEEETENLSEFISKQDRKNSELFYREKRDKIINSAVRKGYDYKLINSVIDDIISEDENISENTKLKEKIKKRFYKYLNQGEEIEKVKYKVFPFFYAKGYSEEILNSVYYEILEEMENEEEL